ncbi:MAG TPA: SET domain-containing protein [Methylomirabilota bacterium]|nr:SET domain-containing protein [Methylomirabilota bacterium]
MILLPKDAWEIKTTKNKGRGVFAKKDIPAGTVIGDYIGKVIKTAEENAIEDQYGLYLMYYHDRASLFPTDPKAPGIHLINHACMPNCWMYTYKGHTLYFALRHIFAGEELTVAYLLGPDESCDPCTHVCKCDGAVCYKTMHLSEEQSEKWNKVNDEQTKKTKRKRIKFGQELPLLDKYPKEIADHPIYSMVGSLEKPSLILTNKILPPLLKLRQLIRESGQTLQFPALNIKIIGVQNETIISEKI